MSLKNLIMLSSAVNSNLISSAKRLMGSVVRGWDGDGDEDRGEHEGGDDGEDGDGDGDENGDDVWSGFSIRSSIDVASLCLHARCDAMHGSQRFRPELLMQGGRAFPLLGLRRAQASHGMSTLSDEVGPELSLRRYMSSSLEGRNEGIDGATDWRVNGCTIVVISTLSIRSRVIVFG